MKTLFLFLSFAFISLTGYSQSQTCNLSSSNSGTRGNDYAIMLYNGNGYTYAYSIDVKNSTVTITSDHHGLLGMSSNPTSSMLSTAGSGNADQSGMDSNIKYWDHIRIEIFNGETSPYGSASLTINPY